MSTLVGTSRGRFAALETRELLTSAAAHSIWYGSVLTTVDDRRQTSGLKPHARKTIPIQAPPPLGNDPSIAARPQNVVRNRASSHRPGVRDLQTGRARLLQTQSERASASRVRGASAIFSSTCRGQGHEAITSRSDGRRVLRVHACQDNNAKEEASLQRRFLMVVSKCDQTVPIDLRLTSPQNLPRKNARRPHRSSLKVTRASS